MNEPLNDALTRVFSRRVFAQLPYTALIWFGCYSLGTISYSMLTFRECPEAAASLLKEIRKARQDLRKKGVTID